MKKLIAMGLILVMLLALGASAFADGGLFTREEARKIALEYAGTNASEAFFTKAREDRDNGRRVYEFEFFVDTTEYEVEVDAKTGRVTDFSVETRGGRMDGGFDSSRVYDDDWYGFDDDRCDRDDWDDRYDPDDRYGWDDWDDRYGWDD